MTIGQRINELRKKRNLTLVELSEAINISKTALSQLENNLYKPSNEVLIKLCNYFKVTADYLLFGNKTSTIYSDTVAVRDVSLQYVKHSNWISEELSDQRIEDFTNDIKKSLMNLRDHWLKEPDRIIDGYWYDFNCRTYTKNYTLLGEIKIRKES